jgi:hypothetical protein
MVWISLVLMGLYVLLFVLKPLLPDRERDEMMKREKEIMDAWPIQPGMSVRHKTHRVWARGEALSLGLYWLDSPQGRYLVRCRVLWEGGRIADILADRLEAI